MKLSVFLIIYFFSLIFETSFMSFFNTGLPISFWVFILCAYFLKKEDILIFGIASSIFALTFFTPFSLYPLTAILSATGAWLIKSFQGLNKKTAFMAHILTTIIIFELLRVFDSFSRHFSESFWKVAAMDAVFLTLLLAVAIFYEIKRGFNRRYSI